MKSRFSLRIAARIGADILMIALIAFAPAYLSMIAALAFGIAFAPYYELILWGLVLDTLYGVGTYHALVGAALAFILIELVRRRMRRTT
jgi:hypothetical protein